MERLSCGQTSRMLSEIGKRALEVGHVGSGGALVGFMAEKVFGYRVVGGSIENAVTLGILGTIFLTSSVLKANRGTISFTNSEVTLKEGETHDSVR